MRMRPNRKCQFLIAITKSDIQCVSGYQRITHTAERLEARPTATAGAPPAAGPVLCVRERPSLTKRKSRGVGLCTGRPNENMYRNFVCTEVWVFIRIQVNTPAAATDCETRLWLQCQNK
jgi:hypothetical protein